MYFPQFLKCLSDFIVWQLFRKNVITSTSSETDSGNSINLWMSLVVQSFLTMDLMMALLKVIRINVVVVKHTIEWMCSAELQTMHTHTPCWTLRPFVTCSAHILFWLVNNCTWNKNLVTGTTSINAKICVCHSSAWVKFSLWLFFIAYFWYF